MHPQIHRQDVVPHLDPVRELVLVRIDDLLPLELVAVAEGRLLLDGLEQADVDSKCKNILLPREDATRP